jgi:hypothetical protein
MVSRQVRYNTGTKTGEQEECRHKWTFIIIDEHEKIGDIKERIYLQLAPITEFKDLYKGSINSSLDYSFFSFFTSKGKFDLPSEISRILVRDNNLIEKNDVGLERYLQIVIKGRM